MVSFKSFTTAKIGQEALSAFEQTLKNSAKSLNEAILENQYKSADKVLDIIVKKGKFDMEKLEIIINKVLKSDIAKNIKTINVDSI